MHQCPKGASCPQSAPDSVHNKLWTHPCTAQCPLVTDANHAYLYEHPCSTGASCPLFLKPDLEHNRMFSHPGATPQPTLTSLASQLAGLHISPPTPVPCPKGIRCKHFDDKAHTTGHTHPILTITGGPNRSIAPISKKLSNLVDPLAKLGSTRWKFAPRSPVKVHFNPCPLLRT